MLIQVQAHARYYLKIDQLSATAGYCQQTALEGSEPSPKIVHSSERWDATSRIMGPDLFCCPATLLSLQCFLNPRFPVSFHLLCPQMVWIMATVSLWQPCDRILVSLKKVGCAINCSLISAHFSISAYSDL